VRCRGDTLGATYSAELIARPGGADVLAVDIANANAYNARQLMAGSAASTGLAINTPDYVAPTHYPAGRHNPQPNPHCNRYRAGVMVGTHNQIGVPVAVSTASGPAQSPMDFFPACPCGGGSPPQP